MGAIEDLVEVEAIKDLRHLYCHYDDVYKKLRRRLQEGRGTLAHSPHAHRLPLAPTRVPRSPRDVERL
jgi:hypothetical protein